MRTIPLLEIWPECRLRTSGKLGADINSTFVQLRRVQRKFAAAGAGRLARLGLADQEQGGKLEVLSLRTRTARSDGGHTPSQRGPLEHLLSNSRTAPDTSRPGDNVVKWDEVAKNYISC